MISHMDVFVRVNFHLLARFELACVKQGTDAGDVLNGLLAGYAELHDPQPEPAPHLVALDPPD